MVGGKFLAQFGPRNGEDANRQQRGVFCAVRADGQGANGNATRHLDDGKNCVETADGVALHRHTKDRQAAFGLRRRLANVPPSRRLQ